MSSLTIPKTLWIETLNVLCLRSAGCRESGAILLGDIGPTGDRTTRRVVPYHELDDDSASEGYVELSEIGKYRLYRLIEQNNLRIIAMSHTHPSKWVGLSPIDQANQISSRVGFWSIVIPNFGQEPWEIQRMGFHIREDRGWRQLDSNFRKQLFKIGG